MSSDFNNRIDAQREFLKIINSRKWTVEPLFSLSKGAIDRWLVANQVARDEQIAVLAIRAGDALYFLANKSQEQVTTEYQRASTDFFEITEQARLAAARK